MFISPPLPNFRILLLPQYPMVGSTALHNRSNQWYTEPNCNITRFYARTPMNTLAHIKKQIISVIQNSFNLSDGHLSALQINLNVDKERTFGDLSCNAAMLLAKSLKRNPRDLAQELCAALKKSELNQNLSDVSIAGPGFINLTLNEKTWQHVALELFEQKDAYYHRDKHNKKQKYLIEFVSANPTGPLHIGHGRNGIIGDVLANVINFLGHQADREFYVNDAGVQIYSVGRSLKVRCRQELGHNVEFPEDGYAGTYMINLARQLIEEQGKSILDQDDAFFANYAKQHLQEQQRETLENYRITFKQWFSELTLHKSGAIEDALELLYSKKLIYEKDGALWFKATEFGDDKDRVIKKADGAYTYIAADIAYHKNKFERGYDKLIDIMGQDHHGYVMRLKATMQALGFDSNNLDVILYQLVSIKKGGEQVRMSKRAGKFETLDDLIKEVGTDVARFFYLNRKAEAHLEFDLDVALKKSDENPVYYIQYAYVRTKSLMEKAKEHDALTRALTLSTASNDDIALIKKICSLEQVLHTIRNSYQTHLLAYYTLELAQVFHNYYAHNKIVNPDNVDVSRNRLYLVALVRQTLATCLNLLGISKPEKM